MIKCVKDQGAAALNVIYIKEEKNKAKDMRLKLFPSRFYCSVNKNLVYG